MNPARRNFLGAMFTTGAVATLPTVAAVAAVAAVSATVAPPKLRRDKDRSLTADEMDKNFSDLDERLNRLEFCAWARK